MLVQRQGFDEMGLLSVLLGSSRVGEGQNLIQRGGIVGLATAANTSSESEV